MKKAALVFIVALAYSATAMASDIAISTQAGWWSQGAADREMQVIADNVTAVPVELFASTDHGALADWVAAHTGNGTSDLLILCGQFPDTIYAPGNTQADDSLAELFLDDGNCIINTGDWMFYVVNGAGTNGPGGLQTMMDIAGVTVAGEDDTAVTVTADGHEYTPSLQNLATDRPFHLDTLEGDWEPELILAQNAAGTRADPVIVKNSATGGRIGIFYQTNAQDNDPRGEVISEWINNWYIPNVAVANPLARGPAPKNGEMVTETTATLQWKAGDFAAVHDVYFGDSLEAVEAATPDDPSVFLGTLSTDTVRVGFTGDPYPEPLVPGQTYYWRVDAVNDANAASPWKGDVWSFWVQPATAYNPLPTDGVPFVLLEPDLVWDGGIGALFHTVFFGESYDEVDNMLVGWMTANTTIAPAEAQLFGPLQPETTYYWRVDEFAMTGVTTKGDVWSFTTSPEIAVSDPDLTGWWTLDEGVGAAALDWSGHGHHGSFVGEPVWVDGYHGGALEFGGGDYVETGADATDLGIEGNKPKTTMAWALTRSFNGGGLWDLGSNNDGRNWSVRTTGNLNEWRVQRYGFPTYDFDVTVEALNEWTHFALVYDGASGGDDSRLYANGELVANQTIELDTNATTRTFQIGLWSGTSFDGVIDDVRVYAKALTEAEIAEAMRGNPLLAGSPNPGPGVTVDVRDATMLSWATGDTAVSHDVYFGTDRAAVAAADNSAPEFQGNQPGTSFSLAGLVEFGGGDYFWRVDEIEADGAVQTGYIWRFNVSDFLVVEDFESYNNEVGSRVFERWIDGIGFTLPEPGNPGNGTGAAVGHDIWSADSPYLDGLIMETANVYAGGQAMPIYYSGALSEADRSFAPGQNWTVEGVTTLVVHFRGQADNTGNLYVEINGVKVPYAGDAADIAGTKWIAWEIDLASVGTNLTNVTTLTIGVEGGTGVLYVDHIILTQP